MKLKQKLAEEFSAKEISCDESIRVNDLGRRLFLAGFEKAREMIAEKFQLQADWAFEGFNQGEATIVECIYTEQLLSYTARKIKRLGEEEVCLKEKEGENKPYDGSDLHAQNGILIVNRDDKENKPS